MLQDAYKDVDVRSRILKRTQKGSEGESTGGGLSAVNGMSSEILYLLDPAQGLFMLEGNIFSPRYRQAARRDPESLARSRYTSCHQGNQ